MTHLPLISGYAAAFLVLLQVILMLRVGLYRQANQISLGDGGDQTLLHRIRCHGNLTENLPIFLILLILLETTGGPANAVMGFAGLFILARLSHAVALSSPSKPLTLRVIGAVGNNIALLGTAGTLVWHLGAA